jgi:hypothetical protein
MKATMASTQAGDEGAVHPGGGAGRGVAADGEHRHAADDPGGAPAADVGAVAEPRAEQLDGVVEGDEGTRQEGRQHQFDHHDAVEHRGGEDDDRAERRLDQPEADDAEPADRLPVHGPPAAKIRTAKALASMPST